MEYTQEFAHNRSKVYGLLSHFYINPPDRKILNLDLETSLKIFKISLNGIDEPFKEIEEGRKILTNYISKKSESFDEESLLSLLKDWTRLLRGVDIKGPLPPYESVYLTGRLQNKPAQEINRLFSKMGIKIPEQWHQPSDYIGVELDFMRLLCEMENEAFRGNDSHHLQEILRIENSFLRNHLGLWVSDFCENTKREAREDFFKGIASLTKGIINYDKILIPYLLERLFRSWS